LLEKGNSKDYFLIESVLKGNYLLKCKWRQEMHEGPRLTAQGTPKGSIRPPI